MNIGDHKVHIVKKHQTISKPWKQNTAEYWENRYRTEGRITLLMGFLGMVMAGGLGEYSGREQCLKSHKENGITISEQKHDKSDSVNFYVRPKR